MGKAKLHFAGILIIIIIALAGVGQEDAAIFYASAYGFLALVSVIFVVSIPILAKVRSKFTLYLLGNRRWIGIYTFVFAIIHFVVVMQDRKSTRLNSSHSSISYAVFFFNIF